MLPALASSPMEAISKITETDFYAILERSQEIFTPILEARRSLIAKTAKETFQYGPTERHKLDVYYPPNGTNNAPILFFEYGGGFVRGSRNLLPGIYFDNVGSFYAARGIFTVIADYRLAPDTKYPGPVEDVRDAVRFVVSSAEVNATGRGANVDQVYLMGHSAGATHVSTLLLHEDILTEKDRSIIKGIVLIAGSYSGGPGATPYYGEGDQSLKTPLGLLDPKSPEAAKKSLPSKILILIGDSDPFLEETGKQFEAKLKEKGIRFEKTILAGHNHFTPGFALSSGDKGEEYGEGVVTFVRS